MFTLSEEDFSFIGKNLNRPECVIATRKGDIFASHAGDAGGIARIKSDGDGEFILAVSGDIPDGFIPNGYSLMPDGSFLIANVGDEGGVYTLKRDGTLIPFITEIDGVKLPACNFANRDEVGRIWISVSTWARNRDESFKKDIADGFIILIDEKGARIVANGIGFTNENKVDPSGRWLFVHETMGRSICRYPISDAGDLGVRETVADYGPGIFPDGFEFDSDGGIWCTSVVSNRILRLAPDGEQYLVFDGGNREVTNRAEMAYQNDTYNREYLIAGNDSILGNCASIGFGGPDLKTCFVGSLASDRIACFRSPVSGAIPPHWNF
ncbi:MAG: gluconolactonase [Rhodospirillaceae bacterium]|nr:gluconolactonase [Rhodospirillaceae bacterium]